MKFCAQCGKQLEDEFRFCNGCGAPTTPAQDPTPNANPTPDNGCYNYNTGNYNNAYNQSQPVTISEDYFIAQEQEQVNTLRQFLNFERTAWKVGTIVLAVVTGLFVLLSMIFFLTAIDARGYREDMYVSMGITYLVVSMLVAPMVFIGFKMVPKCDEYLSKLNYDLGTVVARCTNIGMIVFSAFFNGIAMIFIIINLAKAKANMEILGRAVDRQKGNR
ncbi:MAG: zinc ribbon domain-containing protein [Clostridia bacterium]|nr:zinc ribbon domain-containing protein [Clostridia bacterium]